MIQRQPAAAEQFDREPCPARLAAPIYVLKFRSERPMSEDQESREIRWALKKMLRSFGLRAISIERVPEAFLTP